MPDDLKEAEKGGIPTNMRLIVLIEHVAQEGVPVTPSALSVALGLPKPTVHRLLATAETEGFLQRDVDGRAYGPSHRLRKLAANTLSSQRLRTERMLIMRALAEEVGETCNLAAPGRFGMVYLDRVETHWPLRIQLPRGTQVPFHCTASGKLYLSSLRKDKLQRWLETAELEKRTRHTLSDPQALMRELEQIHKQGYSCDDQEFMDDMSAIAVAVRDDVGRLLTTLSIHAPTQRNRINDLKEFLPQLQAACESLERLI